MISKIYKKIISGMPYVKDLRSELSDLHKKLAFPPGHYYSPIFTGSQLTTKQYDLVGIDLNLKKQLALLNSFKSVSSTFPFSLSPNATQRYYLDNEFYTGYDAMTLYCMLLTHKPNKIIEVGSGYSSALMLDVCELHNFKTELLFIEPNPERLESLIRKNDQCKIEKTEVQRVTIEQFKSLEEGDFLFIDSSHILKTDSDLACLLFNVLPVLKPGVLIHFHDVFYPFEYPDNWIFGGFRSWNELYALRAYLMDNQKYEIVFFNHFLKEEYKDEFPDFFSTANPKNIQIGSIWLKKVEP
jgi:predicted O-methyltransferase YrrM